VRRTQLPADTPPRASLTSQLENMNSIGTLAALLNPPNVIISMKTLDQLVDANLVAGVIERLMRTEGLPENPWLASSLILFRDSLLGRSSLQSP